MSTKAPNAATLVTVPSMIMPRLRSFRVSTPSLNTAAFTAAVFKEGVETLKDLKRGMIIEGTVTNVAAFGAFVDIGVHQDGLVHISAMSKTFIKDPREVVKSGDIVKVKVLEVEVARKRIALTLRLDDETGAKSDRAAAGKPRDIPQKSMTSAAPRKPQAE